MIGRIRKAIVTGAAFSVAIGTVAGLNLEPYAEVAVLVANGIAGTLLTWAVPND